MRYNLLQHICSFLTLCLVGSATAADLRDEVVRTALKQWQVPGVAVVIVHNNEVVYLKGFGVRELGKKEPVTAETLFPLSSCTKAFTTLAMAMLVDEGKMTWDDPVRNHLPSFRLADPLANEQVTLRDLLCHRTGVSGHDLLWYRAPWGVDEQIRRIGLVKPNRSFRAAFQYQNIMVAAAGQAVAAAAGESWEKFVKKQIFTPLEMKTASCTTTEATKSANRTSGHHWGNSGKLEVVPWLTFESGNAALSINASVTDLVPWLRFQLGDGSWGNERLVSERNLAETHMPQFVLRLEGQARREQPCTMQMSYAMGWVVQDYRGHKLISHAGNIDGVRAHITLAPDDSLGLAILSNLQETRMNLALSNALVDQMLGLESRDWNAHYLAYVQEVRAEALARQRRLVASRAPRTQPSRELAAYTGVYEEPAYGTAEIIVEKDALLLKWSSFRAPLEHFHYDTFTALDDDLGRPQIVFSLAADGTVTGFQFYDVEFKHTKAKR
jgi:CubicO group peptidase (beta-lactamase class C family)